MHNGSIQCQVTLNKQKNMSAKLLFLLSLVGIVAFNAPDTFAQKTPTAVRDSLLAKGVIKKTVRSLYVKPLIEQYQGIVWVEGTGFEKPKGDMLRKRGIGLRLGYQWGPYELETGLSFIQPAAGYRYWTKGDFGFSTHVRSIDFHQFPLILRYRFWPISSKLSLRAGVGVAYNIDLNKLDFAPDDIIKEGLVDANGNVVLLARFRRHWAKTKSFLSGEVNTSVQYTFLRRFNATLEVKRLFSRRDVVQLRAVQETFNPPTSQPVNAYGSANSYSVNLGLSYQFGFTNRYTIP